MNNHHGFMYAALVATVLAAACAKKAAPGPGPAPLSDPVSGSEGDTTLAGNDADGDGIRDDLGQYIAGRYDDPAQRNAFKNWARATTVELLATGQAAVYQAQQSVDRAMICVYNSVGLQGGQQQQGELLAALLNNDLRLTAYLNNIQSLGGMVFVGDDKITCNLDGSAFNGQR
jgi:hypothetical protein